VPHKRRKKAFLSPLFRFLLNSFNCLFMHIKRYCQKSTYVLFYRDFFLSVFIHIAFGSESWCADAMEHQIGFSNVSLFFEKQPAGITTMSSAVTSVGGRSPNMSLCLALRAIRYIQFLLWGDAQWSLLPGLTRALAIENLYITVISYKKQRSGVKPLF